MLSMIFVKSYGNYFFYLHAHFRQYEPYYRAGGSSKQIGSLDFGHLDFAGFKHFSEPGLLVIHSNCQYVSVSYS